MSFYEGYGLVDEAIFHVYGADYAIKNSKCVG
jgi:hypothetical protein